MSKITDANTAAIGTTSVTERIFETLDVSFMMSGTYMTVTKNIQSKLHLMYCVLVSCFTLFNTCRMVGFFLQSLTLQDYLATYIALGCTQLNILYLNLVYWFGFHKHYTFLKEEFLRYEINYNLPMPVFIQKRPRILKYILISCLAWSVIGLSVFPVLIFYIFPNLRALFFPFNDLTGWKLVASCFFIIISSIPSMMQYTAVTMLFMICTYVLVQEFDKIVKFTRSDVETMTILKLNTAIKQHEAICDLLSAVNQIIKHFLAGSMVCNFPAQCFLWVTLTNYSSLTTIYFVWVSFMVLLLFLSSFGEYLIAAHVNTMAHKMSAVLWKIDLSCLPVKGLKMIDIFTTKLSGSTIGYDIYGLFTIQKSSILAIFGTILTYFIVAVQFKPDGTGERCLEILKNVTSLQTISNNTCTLKRWDSQRVCDVTECKARGGRCAKQRCQTDVNNCGGKACTANNEVCIDDTCVNYGDNCGTIDGIFNACTRAGEKCGNGKFCSEFDKCVNDTCRPKDQCTDNNGDCSVFSATGTCSGGACLATCVEDKACGGWRCRGGFCAVAKCGETYCRLLPQL